MTVKALTVDPTVGEPILVEGGQQQQWSDVLTESDVTLPLTSQSYAPTITSSGAGVVGVVGTWRALRIGNVVHVIGSLSFTPAVAGVAEDLTFSLPSTMQPTANFGAVTDINGVASMGGPVPATDGQQGPRATAAAKTGTLLGVVANASRAIGVAFTYAVA